MDAIDDGDLARALPEAIRQRLTPLVRAPARRERRVVYWMRIAARDHDNAALDAALHAAHALDAPLLVYHAVSERYPFASDRHHTFMLEGARDVARALGARGIRHVLHVERPGHRGPRLRELSIDAALVVTEQAPVPPLDGWTQRLATSLAEARVPMWMLDASCVVPMPLVSKRPDRAYAFRTATERIARGVLASAWPEAPVLRATDEGTLAFAPVDAAHLDDRDIARLVAACGIDHAVAPVRALPGGSVAGYARWASFRARGLARYASDRNDALVEGTSRLSPYLHHGHVSALRIAREASKVLGDGADKFLDELLVWREVAWHFCARTPPEALHSLRALPDWARETLEAHARDPRDVKTTETLERGRTGDALWDAAQRMLLSHGELHNNVRMTWGKAIAAWTRSPEDARAALVELNHRYALDGRDPASYGGLYWCLGLFDRPCAAGVPVLGAIRPRPTGHHATRLDVAAYSARSRAPTRSSLRRVAVVGAGLAGLACARVLADHNVEVVVFDKGRAAGGRLASRRVEAASFDLGAQYFTARDPRFSRHIASWAQQGVVARWDARVVSLDGRSGAVRETEPVLRWVGTPTMNAIARHLASDLDVRAGHRVDRLDRAARGWSLLGRVAPRGVTLAPTREAGEAMTWDGFDAVAVCLPAEQARALIEAVSPAMAEPLAKCRMTPCLALAVTLPEGAESLPFDGAFVGRAGDGLELSWIACESSKPGRAPGNRWMLHASEAWSDAHFASREDDVTRDMLDAFARATGCGVVAPVATHLHRWRFARPAAPCDAESWIDEDARLACGGDFASGGRVEGAFLSGLAVAGRLLGLPEPSATAPTSSSTSGSRPAA